MEYRYLGKSGLKVSALSFGSWVTFGDQVGEETAAACMKAAYEAGVNFFDCAEGYSAGKAEIMMGNIIRKAGWKRSDLVISTKIFWGGKGPNDRACPGSISSKESPPPSDGCSSTTWTSSSATGPTRTLPSRKPCGP